MTLRVLLPAAAILAIAVVTGASTQADGVGDYITSELARQKIPGLSLAVVKNGEVVKAQGYGLSNLELKVPATSRDRWASSSRRRS